MEEEELGELPADAPVDNTACQIYVGNLSWQATEEVLRAEFEDIGRVVNVKVLIDHETGHNKGYCFITFEDEECAIRAIAEKNGKELEGRSMKVNHALGSHKGRDSDERYYKPRSAWGKGGKGNGGPRGSVFGEGRLEEDPYPEGRARGPRGPEAREWQQPGRGVSGREARDVHGRERDDPYESEHPPPRVAYRESRGPAYDDFGLQPDSRDRHREAYRDGYRGEGRRSSYRTYGEGQYLEAAYGGPETGYRDSYAYPEETESYVAPVRDAAYRQAPSRDTYEPEYERSGGYEAAYERAPVGYRSEAPYPSRRVGHAEGGYARSGSGDYGALRGGGPPLHSAYDDDGYSYYEYQPRGGKDYTKDYAEREYQGRDYGAKRDVAVREYPPSREYAKEYYVERDHPPEREYAPYREYPAGREYPAEREYPPEREYVEREYPPERDYGLDREYGDRPSRGNEGGRYPRGTGKGAGRGGPLPYQGGARGERPGPYDRYR